MKVRIRRWPLSLAPVLILGTLAAQTCAVASISTVEGDSMIVRSVGRDTQAENDANRMLVRIHESWKRTLAQFERAFVRQGADRCGDLAQPGRAFRWWREAPRAECHARRKPGHASLQSLACASMCAEPTLPHLRMTSVDERGLLRFVKLLARVGAREVLQSIPNVTLRAVADEQRFAS
jgi:hypothetical protein